MIPLHAYILRYDRPRGLARVTLKTWPGRVAQAAFFRWLAGVDAALADAVHDAPSAPYSLTLRGIRHLGRGVFVVATHVELRVAVAGKALAAAMARVEEQPLVLRLYDASLSPTVVATPERGGVNTRADVLMQVSHAATSYRVTFQAPTLFRPNGLDDPMPTPLAFFGGLYERWTRVVGLPLPLGREALMAFLRHHVLAGRFNLRTVPVHFKERVRGAVVGSVVYEVLDRDPSALITLTVLARFARIMGAGAYTGMAMGAVTVEERDLVPVSLALPVSVTAMGGVGPSRSVV